MVAFIYERFSETQTKQRALIVAVVCGVAVIFTTLQDQDMSITASLGLYLSWLTQMGLGLVFALFAARQIRSVPGIGQRDLLASVLAGLVGAVLYTPLAYYFDCWLESSPPASQFVPLLAALSNEFVSLAPAYIGVWLFLKFTVLKTPAQLPMEEYAEPEGLLAQLPHALGSEVLVIHSELNYLNVTTAKGSTSVRYSLRQAAEDLGEVGMLIHRSCWIATAGVTRVRRDGVGVCVELSTGETVRPSRRKQAQVLTRFGSDYRAAS